MSKRALKGYLKELSKEQLEEHVLDLYHRFKEVRAYYHFVFNPKEDKLIEEAKIKISQEYFPTGKRKKAKMRRSVAHKHIKNSILLGVDPLKILDLMIYTIEVAQANNATKANRQDAFYRSMLKSFEEALRFSDMHGMFDDVALRMEKLAHEAKTQEWFNYEGFERLLSEQRSDKN